MIKKLIKSTTYDTPNIHGPWYPNYQNKTVTYKVTDNTFNYILEEYWEKGYNYPYSFRGSMLYILGENNGS